MVIIVQNRFLQHWRDLPELLTTLSLHGTNLPGGFYRPVQMLLFFLMYQVFGLSAAVFHAMNILLHAITTCLVYRLGQRLGYQMFTAFMAALIWGVHPLFTETVDYVSGSAEPLYAAFCLAGILALLPDFAPRKFWMSGLFFILALGSKESAIVFPALATFTLFLVSKERLTPSLYLRTWPLWLIMVVYLIILNFVSPEKITLLMHDPADMQYDMLYTHNIINRLLTSLATLPVYLGLIIWPEHLHMERSYPVFSSLLSWPVLAGMAMTGAALLQIIWGKGGRGLACSWGLLWFAAAFSPYTGIIMPINSFIAEHWLYLPGIGLSLGFAQTISVWIERQKSEKLRNAIAGLSILAAVALGGVTFSQNRVWHDPEAFYQHIFDCGEESGRAHSSLAQYYFNIGEYDRAKEQYLAALAHPAPLWLSQTSLIHIHLAFIYLGARPNENGLIAEPEVAKVMRLTPQLSEAIAELEKTVDIDPDYYWAHKFLSMIYDYQGEKNKADFHAQRARSILNNGRDPDRLL